MGVEKLYVLTYMGEHIQVVCQAATAYVSRSQLINLTLTM
jgi:hypothetical protein